MYGQKSTSRLRYSEETLPSTHLKACLIRLRLRIDMVCAIKQNLSYAMDMDP